MLSEDIPEHRVYELWAHMACRNSVIDCANDDCGEGKDLQGGQYEVYGEVDAKRTTSGTNIPFTGSFINLHACL